jgi:hypothetical protein
MINASIKTQMNFWKRSAASRRQMINEPLTNIDVVINDKHTIYRRLTAGPFGTIPQIHELEVTD